MLCNLQRRGDAGWYQLHTAELILIFEHCTHSTVIAMIGDLIDIRSLAAWLQSYTIKGKGLFDLWPKYQKQICFHDVLWIPPCFLCQIWYIYLNF